MNDGATLGTGISRGQWMALTAALLGWMFDGLEMGLFPLVAGPALRDLLPLDQHAHVGFWFGIATAAFLIGAATGGVLFGWLGDRIGRVRAMMLSVLTYAIFSGLCGLAGSPVQIAVLRFISALGMGGEWSLGVALVMEIWPDRSRAFLAGLIGAAANVGYLLIAFLGLALGALLADVEIALRAIGVSDSGAAWLVANSGWRLLMMAGALPALLTFFIRLFVPESERWQEEKARGTTSHWATQDLLGVLVGAGAGLGIIALWAVPNLPVAVRIAGSVPAFVIAALGYLYPVAGYLRRAGQAESGRLADVEPGQPFADMPSAAVREGAVIHGTTAVPATLPTPFASGTSLDAAKLRSLAWWQTMQRMGLGACLGGVALLGTWASIQWAPTWADFMHTQGQAPAAAKSYTQITSSVGAIIGTILAALVGGWLGRRITYFALCLGSLASSLLLFQGSPGYGATFLCYSFLAGGLTASFYGWLPLYLPELFPTKVRATGQGFSFNFGRIIAAIGALQGGYLIREVYQQDYATVCSIMSLIYLVGVAIIWLAPETKGQPLPE